MFALTNRNGACLRKNKETLQEQQLLYRIYNLQFAYEKLDNCLKSTQSRINQIDIEIKEKEEALKIAETQQQQAQVVYKNWISLQDTDKRRNELERLKKLHSNQEDLLKQASTKLNQSRQSVINLREWGHVLPVMVTALVENTNLTIPVAVDCLTTMINVSEMKISEIQAQLHNLYDWTIEVKAQLERQLSDLRSNIERVKADLTKISQGKFPNERAYDVREILTRHGPVQVLCDLIEEVDTQWQPIIEKLMGGRRFTLITNENNYQDCLSTFRSLSARETDGVHLARPKDAEQSQRVQTGSLAEKVKAKNWIAQGLLNRHLNGLQACDDDDEAVKASQSVATQTGLIVRGGTIQRLRPLDDKELVFDRESRERKRKQLVAELEQFDSLAAVLIEKLKGLDSSQNTSLQQKINYQLRAINLIDFSLPEQEKKLQAELISLSVEIRAIEESNNFVALQENVDKAERDYKESIEKCTRLKDKIDDLASEKVQLTESQKTNQADLEITRRQLAQYDNIEWQSGYEQVKSILVIESSDITNELEEKRRELKREVELTETQLEKAIRGYINEYSPILSTHSLEQQRIACLQEYDRLQSLELQKFQDEQKRYRSEAENILKTTFFDALLKEHKTIRSGIRDLNKAIQYVKLGSRNYRFNAEHVNTNEVQAVCEMLNAYETLKPEQQVFDLTHQIFETHRVLIDRLFELFQDSEDNLTRSAYETRRTLLTPTKYFKFDLQARQDDTDWFSLNRYYDIGSGGEHQNPLYILLAGTMLQLYANNSERPRLVIIDEAFGKAPFSAGPGLKMLLNEGLQPIVSTVLNQPQVEEVIGYTAHISRPNIGHGRYKKLVYVITDQKESF